MDRIYSETVTLSKLRRRIESGIFAVPELQREFVWSPRKACDLLDSVYRNYPIGTILIWKASRRSEGELRKHLHILPAFNSKNKHIWFLIDGQQRLSVLWHLLRSQPATVRNANGDEINFGHIFFDPYAADGERLFVYRRRAAGELAQRLVPVVDLLSPQWRRRLEDHGTRATRKVEVCRERILNYRSLLVFCETNDKREVRQSFVRINALGTPIGSADRAFARASRFKMRPLVAELQENLKHGFDRIGRSTILQTTALALGSHDLGERAIDAMVSRLEASESERKRFHRGWPKLRTAFGLAADYAVYELGVPNFGFLPSEPMATILTLFFFHHGNVRPSRAAKEQLRRWFWTTAVGARYTGSGYRPNLLRDAEFVARLASNPRTRAPAFSRVPVSKLKYVEYNRPGPLSNAYFCLLRLQRPRYLEDGAEIPLGEISSRGNRSDKHHIFPRSLLERNGISQSKGNSILNICYLVARENQSVGRQPPSRYLTEVPRNKRALASALRSHLIPTDRDCGIWDNSVRRGFNIFLEHRARLIAAEFEHEAGIRLFERT